jgi:hypothetical protein
MLGCLGELEVQLWCPTPKVLNLKESRGQIVPLMEESMRWKGRAW